MKPADLTRQAGLDALQKFVPRAADYARRRNFVDPQDPAATCSGLSAYLQRRLIAEPEVIEAVLAHHSAQAVDKYLQEVVWRTYWKGWLEHRPTVWRAYLQELRAFDSAEPDAWPQPVDRQQLAAAQAGRTGIACFDAWAQQLVASGFLHNHVRMWFASIWIFTLKLPWSLGAAFFYRHLRDGDPASNTLSWRWVAGLQTAGKTYLARPDNIAKYTEGRFADVRGLATAAPPQTEAVDHPLMAPHLAAPPKSWPTQRLGLLICLDDLSCERSVLGQIRPVALASLDPAWRPLIHPVADAPLALDAQALADAEDRAQAHFGAALTRLRPPNVSKSAADHAELPRDPAAACQAALHTWVQHNRLQAVVLAQPFVGPWNDILQRFVEAAPQQGLQVIALRRAHDRRLFPAATHGFFRLKKRLGSFGGDR